MHTYCYMYARNRFAHHRLIGSAQGRVEKNAYAYAKNATTEPAVAVAHRSAGRRHVYRLVSTCPARRMAPTTLVMHCRNDDAQAIGNIFYSPLKVSWQQYSKAIFCDAKIMVLLKPLGTTKNSRYLQAHTCMICMYACRYVYAELRRCVHCL